MDSKELEKIQVYMKDVSASIEEFKENYGSQIDTRIQDHLKPILKEINEQRLRTGAPALGGGNGDGEPLETNGFDNLGEFLAEVRFNPTDSRVRELEERALSAGSSAGGGALIPSQFADRILQIPAERAIFRPLATIFGAGDPPDAEIGIPALDQAGTKGINAGVEVSWIGEGGEKPETATSADIFDLIKLKPNEVAAHVVITDKLLRNAPVASTVVSMLLRNAIFYVEEDNFVQGPGSGRPLGIIGHSSTIEITRYVMNRVFYTDLTGMMGRALWGGGPFIWLASQTILPELMEMESPAGDYIWPKSARDTVPTQLLGIPLRIFSNSPVLGSKGDLMLVDLSYYVIKDGSPLRVEASPHVYFTSNKTIIKATWNVDGQPWLRSPLTLRDGSTTVSPFVVLSDAYDNESEPGE